jgi:dihydroneopterin aldolase
LAEKISNDIMLKYTVVESSVVRVRKPFAPIKGIFDNIEFEIVKKRNDYE